MGRRADGALPFFRRIIIQTVPEPATRANLVERGDADLAIDLAASDMPTLEKSAKAKVVSIPQTNGFTHIAMNTQMAPFDNVKVRKAVAAALPYDDMFKAAIFSRGRKLYGAGWSTTPPNSSFPQAIPNKTDPALAKKLLAEAGFPNGFSTTFAFTVGAAATAEPMAALVKESLGKVGIQVEIQKKPDAEFNTLASDRKMPFFTDGATAWLPYTYYFFYLYFTRQQRWNFASCKSTKMEELTLEARYQTDKAKYDAGCKEMIELFAAADAADHAVAAQPRRRHGEVGRRLHLPVLPPGRLPRSQAGVALLAAIAGRVGRRLLASIPALLGVIVVTFIADACAAGRSRDLLRLRPRRRAGGDRGDCAARMGLDKPIPVQLVRYLGEIAQGDFGRSMTTGQPVVLDIRRRLPASLELTCTALALALSSPCRSASSPPCGQGSLIDHAVRLLCTLGVCVPTFVSGLLLIYAFYYLLGWAPDPTARIDIFASPPPDITGFYLIDFAATGDWDGWWAASASSCCRPSPWRCSCWRRLPA